MTFKRLKSSRPAQPNNKIDSLPISFELDYQPIAVFAGGSKSPEHQAGQDRLERIFIARHFYTHQEDRTWCFNEIGELKEYQVDLMIMTLKSQNLCALEVDDYGPHHGKRKNPEVMKQRDQLISKTFKIPVIRFDVDCLKESKRNKYFMSDDDIFNYTMASCVKYYKDTAIRWDPVSGKLINIE